MSAKQHVTPLPISVLIPAYNRAHLLPRALASVRAQQPRPPAEVIVVDDGSKDETANVAEKLGAKVIQHPRNRGLAAARNTGLQAASSSWVAFLDSDDEWLPHHLAHLWELRAEHTLVASSALRCGPKPTSDRVHGPLTRKAQILRTGEQLVNPENIIPVSATMVKRETVVALGGFQDNWGVEDFDLWLRILEHHTGICSSRVSIIYYVHREQMSTQSQRMRRGQREAIEAHKKRTNASNIMLQRWEAAMAWSRLREAFVNGNRREAVHWGLHIISKPSRLTVMFKIVINRFRSWRRAVAVRRAGVKPSR